jgi:antirestriction protein ArdC
MPIASSLTTCAIALRKGRGTRGIPFLKRFTVFNADQCAGLREDVTVAPAPVDASLILPQVEELIRATAADVRIGGDKAYYDVAGDFIRVPPPQAFFEPINFSRTLNHELAHYAEVRIMPRQSVIARNGRAYRRGTSA